jgi:hypothetical protein
LREFFLRESWSSAEIGRTKRPNELYCTKLRKFSA